MKTVSIIFLIVWCVSSARAGVAEPDAQPRRAIGVPGRAPAVIVPLAPKSPRAPAALRVNKPIVPLPVVKPAVVLPRNPRPAGLGGPATLNNRNTAALNGTAVHSRAPKQ